MLIASAVVLVNNDAGVIWVKQNPDDDHATRDVLIAAIVVIQNGDIDVHRVTCINS